MYRMCRTVYVFNENDYVLHFVFRLESPSCVHTQFYRG